MQIRYTTDPDWQDVEPCAIEPMRPFWFRGDIESVNGLRFVVLSDYSLAYRRG